MKEELQRKYESYLALRKGRRLSGFLVVLLFASAMFGWIFVIFIGLWGLGVWAAIVILVLAIVKKIPSSRIEPSENRMFLRICDALRNIEYYFDDPMAVIHLERARKNLDKLISSIRQLTPTTHSMILRKAINDPLQRLANNLERRILPLIDYPRSSKNVQQAYSRLESLAFIFIEPATIAQNLPLCNQMLEELPEEVLITFRFRERLSIFFSAHKILRDVLVLSTFIIGSCVFYYMAVGYLDIVKEYAFTGSVAIFIGLATIYFRRQPKE